MSAFVFWTVLVMENAVYALIGFLTAWSMQMHDYPWPEEYLASFLVALVIVNDIAAIDEFVRRKRPKVLAALLLWPMLAAAALILISAR